MLFCVGNRKKDYLFFMNSKDVFTLALGLRNPWIIKSVTLKEVSKRKVLYIEIDFERGSNFTDPLNKEPCSVHDTKPREWRHLDFFEHECYIKCRVPRIKPLEGNIRQVPVPWAREGSGFTLLFEAYGMALIENEMPVNKVGKLVNESPNRIWTIFNYWISIAYNKADHSKVSRLGFDETSVKKGHKYITLAVDLDERKVVHVTQGKDAQTITNIKDYLEKKGCVSEQIQEVCIDLSPSFISGVTKEFEEATLVFDRFHVKALLNKAMDEVRKIERRSHELIKGHKYTFLAANKNLTNRQRKERDELIELFPVLGEAYRLKILFDDFWEMKDSQEAAGFLAFWCDIAQASKIQPMIKFGKTVNAHWTGIVNYINTPINNGILEGINSKIQLLKARARGFRNTTNFINMIYFLCGKLNFDYPHKTT